MVMPCKYPRCPSMATGGGYCDDHKPDYNYRSKKSYDKLYQLPWWRRWRALHISREPLCQRCRHYNITTPAVHVDHIIPHRGDMDIFKDTDMMQSLCHSCHSWKTSKEKKGVYWDFRGGNATIWAEEPD